MVIQSREERVKTWAKGEKVKSKGLTVLSSARKITSENEGRRFHWLTKVGLKRERGGGF